MKEVYQEDEHVSHLSPWPMVIALGTAVLFMGIGIATFALGVGLGVLVLGLVLLVGGVVGWLRESMYGLFIVPEEPPGAQWPFEGISRLKLGTLVFLGGEIMLFGTVLATVMYLRVKSTTWPAAGEVFNISLGASMTYILLTSALTFFLGVVSLRQGKVGMLRLGLILTLLLGAGFLAIKLGEWISLLAEGVTPSSGIVASTYYFTTGVHGLHVLVGLIGLLYFLISSMKGKITKESHEPLTLFGLYWIFVDILWLFIFPIIYLW